MRRTEAAMGGQEPEAFERILAELRRYLAAYPSATDTAAGIMRWWLHSDPDAAGSLADIERALERLEAEGELERFAATDGRLAYRSRPRR